MVDEAKAKALFQDLPAGREKGEVIWLMELASVKERIKLTLLTVRFLVKGYGVYIENIHESS